MISLNTVLKYALINSFYLFFCYMDQQSPHLLSLRNGLLDFINLSVNRMVHSLSCDHDPESVKICEVFLCIAVCDLLRPSCLLPRLDSFGLAESLSDYSRARCTADVNLEIGQR